MAQAVTDSPVYATPIGGGGGGHDWDNPISWEMAGWKQGADGLYRHPAYPNTAFATPPRPPGFGAGGGAGDALTATGSGGGVYGQGLGMAGSPTAPATLAGASAAGGSAIDRAMQFLRPGLAGAALIGGATQAGGSNQLPPELQQMLDLQRQRMQSQQPLFDAITQMAMNRLPISQQRPMGSTGGTSWPA